MTKARRNTCLLGPPFVQTFEKFPVEGFLVAFAAGRRQELS
jgi:hypothetical protein